MAARGVTSTASTLRYGNQGGRFAPTRQTATCLTCRNGTARWMCIRSTPDGRPQEAWPVCTTCRAQGERLSTLLEYTAIGTVAP